MGYLSPYIIDSIVYQKAVYGLNVFVPKEFDYLYNGVQIANLTVYYFLDQVLVNTPRWSYLS